MLTHADLLRIARRHDTLMAHAMMRALGFEPSPWGWPRRGGGRVRPTTATARAMEERRYRGLSWCFENHGSPMDGAR